MAFLPGSEGGDQPFFSPDGQSIGFTAGGQLKKIPMRGGPAVTLCDAPNLRGASWAPDGSIVATLDSSAGTGLSRIPAEGGAPKPLTRPGDRGEQTHRWPQILPGGESVLFTGHTSIAGFDEANIEALSLKTGEIKVVQRRGYHGRYIPTDRSAGYLVYLHEGVLFGVPMNPSTLVLQGTPQPLLQDVTANSTTGAAQFDFSESGSFVYRSGSAAGASVSLAWLDHAGQTKPIVPADDTYFTPRLSPDGLRLAYARNSGKGLDLYVYDLKRQAASRLTFDGQENSNPVWASDGRHITYRSSASSGDSIRWIRSDGGDPQVLHQSKDALVPTSFAPGDQRLSITEAAPGAAPDIFTLPLDLKDPEHPKAANPEVFLKTPASEYAPAFSPDGHWMAYASDESGRFEVFVRSFPVDASGGAKWQVSTTGGSYPFWSRTANEMFYRAPDNRIFVFSYSAKGGTFTADTAKPWSDVAASTTGGSTFVSLDLAPDGKRFVIMSGGASAPPSPLHVTFLLNFFDELHRRAKNAPKP